MSIGTIELMILRTSWLSVIVGAALCGIVALGMFPNLRTALSHWMTSGSQVTRNFRVTLALTLDGKPKTFSVVQRFKLSLNAGDGQAVGFFGDDEKGEAIVADLARDLPLLVALMYHVSEDDYYHLFSSCIGAGKTAKEFLANVRAFKGSCFVPPGFWPLFITISDRADPGTIERFVPGKTLASRVVLTSVSLTATDDPVTSGRIAQLFPWVFNHRRANVYGMDPSDSPNGLPLASYAFARPILPAEADL